MYVYRNECNLLVYSSVLICSDLLHEVREKGR